MTKKIFRVLSAVLPLFYAAVLLASTAEKSSLDKTSHSDGMKNNPLVWYTDFDTATAKASIEYKPIMIEFMSPDCPWCSKLEKNVISSKKLKPLLREVILLRIDTTKDFQTPKYFNVSAIPVLSFCSSDGRELLRLNGYVNQTAVLTALKSIINGKIITASTPALNTLISHLKNKTVKDSEWRDIILAVGHYPDSRDEIIRLIRLYSPFPVKTFVKMLRDPRIAVRLGALDFLEEISGDVFNFDPWMPLESRVNIKALDTWEKWASVKTNDNKNRFSPLTEKRCFDLLTRVVCGDRGKSRRALRILRRGGKVSLKSIETFLASKPEISREKKNRLKSLQYSLLIPTRIGKDPVILAEKLLYGKLDARMQAILTLKNAGDSVIPIMKDLLKDQDPMIRETAIDSLVAAANEKSIPILKKHLATEKDTDVIYASLRSLAELKDPRTAEIFNSFLDAEDENIVIAALQGIASLKKHYKSDKIAKTLKDRRWRIRVAAIDTVIALKMKKLAPAIEKMLFDKDEFVRYKAVVAISRLNTANAASILEKAFLEDDSLKGAVVAAFGSLDKLTPPSFNNALKGKNKDVLMNVLQGIREGGKATLPVAVFLAKNKDEDIRIPALRFIAENGVSRNNSKYNSLLLTKFKNGTDKEKLAIMRSFRLPHKKNSFGSSEETDSMLIEIQEEAADEKKSEASKKIVDLFEAFDDNPTSRSKNKKAIAKTQKPTKESTTVAAEIVDLFEAFEGNQSENKNTGGRTSGTHAPTASTTPFGKASLDELKSEIKIIFINTKDSDIKFSAAGIMALFEYAPAVSYLKKSFNGRSVEERRELLSLFLKSQKSSIADFAVFALHDTDNSVRKRAAAIILESKKKKPIQQLLKKITDPRSNIRIYDISSYKLRNLHQTSYLKKYSRKWAIDFLSREKIDPVLATFAIFILEKTGIGNKSALLVKYTKSTNKWLRRAAFHALGRNRDSYRLFEKFLPIVLNDPEPEVRITIPKIIQKRASRNFSNQWVHFYDDKHFFSDYEWSSSGTTRRITEQVEKALRKLTDDNDRKVRMEAFFALLACRKSIDLTRFVKILNSFPDKHAISYRVKDFLTSNYRTLGESFAVLLPFIPADDFKNDPVRDVFKHFSKFKKGDSKKPTTTPTLRKGGKNRIQAVYLKTAETEKKNAVSNGNMRFVYFTKKGCRDCARVERHIDNLKKVFPEMIVETHDISKVSSIRLNETYCEHFNVPEKIRLVAPAIFSGGGFLIKNDINMDSLVQLAATSASIPLSQWYNVTEKDFISSEKRIKQRYEKTSIWMIIFAGLLDGINPCAFATIIFFLSYLRIAGRKPGEILLVSLSFISAVFISYLAFGLGLNELIARLYIFEIFRIWLNRIMAVIVFSVMVMSFYDGVLCVRGRMKEMSLQLPEFLKKRIRKTIRTGSKNRRFIISAFIVGCIVSFLELACTGQVYAPMIAYMWQTGNDYAGSLFYLILYNIMFIVPLVAIFLTAYVGLKNNTLITFFQKHAAVVKFATALLFLILLLSILSNMP